MGSERYYLNFYKSAKDQIPSFPNQYPTGVLLGRVDLINVLHRDEYTRAVKEELREENNCEYQFVFRNPSQLDLPLRIGGNQGIFKLAKETLFGVKDLVRPVDIGWWESFE